MGSIRGCFFYRYCFCYLLCTTDRVLMSGMAKSAQKKNLFNYRSSMHYFYIFQFDSYQHIVYCNVFFIFINIRDIAFKKKHIPTICLYINTKGMIFYFILFLILIFILALADKRIKNQKYYLFAFFFI